MLTTKTYQKLLLHSLLWTIALAVLAGLFFLQSGHIPRFLKFQFFFGIALFYFNYFVLIPKLLFNRKIMLYILAGLAMIFLITFLSEIAKPLFFHKRTRFLSHFGHRFILDSLLFSTLFIAATAIKIYSRWNENEKNKQRIIAEKAAAELHYLKNQINPHFLFNSLNGIYALTVKKSELAPEAVLTLSELMRYMLYETDKKTVPLQQEIDYLRNYIKLQKMRIVDSRKVVFDVKGNAVNQEISPLLLISFVENAFKYGNNPEGETAITISIVIEDGELFFQCENKKHIKPKTTEHSGIGIQNTQERLQLTYPQRHSLILTDTRDEFKVALFIKLKADSQ